jgi:hypothetical protein
MKINSISIKILNDEIKKNKNKNSNLKEKIENNP